uniref:DUF223 domain-containing protein n=1 Tax=Triticum urartu TaxID=4572 RepID=A0A8R7PF41_TRIUA
MDLVVLDSQGNHMYVQRPPQAAKRLQHELEEGKVYMKTKFNCIESKPTLRFRAVESPYMIQFTRFSNVVLRPGLEADYPFCTYNLVPFEDIRRPRGRPVHFLDVIGRITNVSDVIPIHSSHQPEPSSTRTIILTDLQ